MKVKSLTLMELIVAIVVVGFLILGAASASIFFVKRILYNLEYYNVHSQVKFALEDMQIRCISAVDTATIFDPSGGAKGIFEFKGEKNIYNVTPDDPTLWSLTNTSGTKVWYKYCVDSSDDCIAGTPDLGHLVLGISTDSRTSYTIEEVLVDGRYSPNVSFVFTENDEPNFITATVEAQGARSPEVKASETEGIRTWFIDLVQ